MVSAAVRDIQPRELAEGMAALAELCGDQDSEVAAILREASQRLQIVAWNRYAAHHNRLCRRHGFVRRHQQRARTAPSR